MKVVSALKDGLVPTSALDYIVVSAEEEEEADVMINRLDTTIPRYSMAICSDKTEVMTNSPDSFQSEIKIKSQGLEAVENFMYLPSQHADIGPLIAKDRQISLLADRPRPDIK